MICPRCESDNAELMVKAPVNEAWQVYICNTCYFSWRSTEDELIRDPKKYDNKFKINPKEIPHLISIPPVPKIKVKTDCSTNNDTNK